MLKRWSHGGSSMYSGPGISLRLPSSLLWPGASQTKPGSVCPVASQGMGAFGRVQSCIDHTSLSSLSPESPLHWVHLWSPCHPALLDTAVLSASLTVSEKP